MLQVLRSTIMLVSRQLVTKERVAFIAGFFGLLLAETVKV
jgi:hypothetical protein